MHKPATPATDGVTGALPATEPVRSDRENVRDHQAQQVRLDQLFRKAGDGEETRALYRAVLEYRRSRQP